MDVDGLVAIRSGTPCAYCGRIESKMVVDHDPATGEIRGILCNTHNVAFGHFGDSIEGLLKAIDYLRNPPIRGLMYSDYQNAWRRNWNAENVDRSRQHSKNYRSKKRTN